MIRRRVLHSGVIGTDETGVKIDGKKHWFWTWQNKRATFIATFTNRGTTTIDENVSGIFWEAVLVHDFWKAHFQTPVKAHQLCTAHLERETKYLEECYKVAWLVRFRAMLRQAHKLIINLLLLTIVLQTINGIFWKKNCIICWQRLWIQSIKI